MAAPVPVPMRERVMPCSPRSRSSSENSMPTMAPMLSALADAVGLKWKVSDTKILQRDRSPSDCSTRADSDVASSDVASDSDCEGVDTLCLERNTVIIFDWDDTLLPTAFLRSSPLSSSAARREAIATKLREHARKIEKVLRVARSVARVSVVTLSKRPWMDRSAERHLPALNLPDLIRELGITVYYAQEESDNCPGALAAEDWTTLKRSAMARCLDDWRIAGALSEDSSDRLSVISIGDAEIEQQALKTLIGASTGVLAEKPLSKTVKLMDGPTLTQLGEELVLLPPWLRRMAVHDMDFDVTIKNPEELATRAAAAGL